MMSVRARRLGGWWVVPLFSVASVGAAGTDVRLVEAVKNGDTVAVRALLQQQGDVNASEVDGTTPLHWAAHRDDLQTADLLIRAGADVKATNRYGVTPLSLACTNGGPAMIEMLLKAGADPNTTLPEGETALMTAARTGNADAVKVLLVRGADVNAKESWRGQTALMWAAAEGHADVIRALVERGADLRARSNKGFTPLLYAVREGQLDAVRALVEAGTDVNETLPPENRGPDARPVVSGGLADLPGGTSALVLAVMNAHYEVAALLLDAGADPNADAQGWTALHEVTWVRRPGGGANFPGPVGSGNMYSLDLVRKLAAHGANLNARMSQQPRNGLRTELNRIGATPFLMAARHADAALMRLLAELGADPLLGNEDRTTSLMAAAGVGVYSPGEDAGTESEVLEATKVAWELGGDVNAVDDKGETAMHGAVYMGANSVVQFLVDKGAKIEVWNQKNSRGWTPLTIADGVFRAANFRHAPHTAVLLRRLITGTASANSQPQ